MEHAESSEQAVRREVGEETGIQVGKCCYHSSQPWPFPYSLMLGFLGTACSTDIVVDPEELEDARWFMPEDLKLMIARAGENTSDLRVPPSGTIAHHLIRAHLASLVKSN